MSDKETNRNRATMAPGGCECSKCGCIFIGGVEHDLCGVCADKANEVPSGWKLVPIEPTAEMKIAGDNAGFWCGDKWRAMLAAAPQPASEQQAARGLSDDARECLMDVVSHHANIVACFAAQRREAQAVRDTDSAVYWDREIAVARRMKAQTERALAAAKGDGHA